MQDRHGTRVLVVEDERIVARDLQEMLLEMGYDPYAVAASADEAIARAAERAPDLALLDIRIRGSRDGITLAGLLREQFGVPVVFLTAHADDATLDRAKRTEPYGYLVKPVKAAELRSAIEIALFRHAMEKRLRESERWFATTLHSIADAVVTVDLAGNVRFMNAAAEALTGVSRADALGRPAREVVRVVAPPEAAAPLERALDARAPISLREATLATAAGPERVIADSVAPVVDRDEMLGAVMVFRDITEHKQLQRQLEVADRLASLGTMAAGVAHEVNNPLSVVIANATYVQSELERLASERPDDGALAEAISAQDDLARAASRIARIVGELRAFARPTPSPSADADVARAVDWAVRSTAAELRHRARLRVDLGGVAPVAIDETRLGQILVNLLINAAHAIAPGHPTTQEVVISAHARGDRVVLEVRDTGCGMAPEVQARIFEPFFTTKPVGVGTGLGLAICHGIVGSVGGDISCESQVGVGTVFRVSLPAATRARTPTAPAAPVAGARGRVLIIDDEPMVLKTMARMLRDHDLTAVASARDALALLRRGERFDVILSDVMMPEMTGMELYEQLLRDAPDVVHQIVFVSGGVLTAKVGAFLASIPNRALAKPILAPELRALIEGLIASRRGGAVTPT